MHRSFVLASIVVALAAASAAHAGGPDGETVARLFSATGDVRLRTSADAAWAPATRGMELLQAWGVSTARHAAAEITFLGTQRVLLREDTAVVVVGPPLKKARTGAPEAVIEHGSLRTDIAPLPRKGPPPITVTMPSAYAVVGTGSAVVSVTAGGVSIISNHGGRAIDLRGMAGGRVSVAAGMGSRVAPDQLPEAPRPLPAPPTWTPDDVTSFIAVDGKATLRASWLAVPSAATYRFEVHRRGVVVATGEVSAPATELAVKNAPAGDYQVQVAAIDADGLESPLGDPRLLTARAVAIAAPGAELVAVAPGPDDEPIAGPSDADAFPMVAVSGRIIAGADLLCDGNHDGVNEAISVLRETGVRQVHCVDGSGTTYAPFPLEVDAVDVTTTPAVASLVEGEAVELDVAIGSVAPIGLAWRLEPTPGLVVEGTTRTAGGWHTTVRAADDAVGPAELLVIDDVTQRIAGRIAIAITAHPTATPPPIDVPVVVPPAAPAGPARFSIGAFVGWLHEPYDGELGNSLAAEYVVDSGPAFGARAAWWFSGRWFVEGELDASPGGFVGADDSAWVVIAHGHVGARLLEHDRLSLRALVGGGGYFLTTDATRAADDFDLGLDYGVAGVYDLGGSVHLRVDGRQHVVPDRLDGLTSAFELDVGLELALPRR